MKWYSRAADQAHLDSQFRLGSCHELGRGVAQDYVEAYKWYNLVGAFGHQRAVEARDKVIRLMSPWQITEGQKRASEAYKLVRQKLAAGKEASDKLKEVLGKK